ncbi:hypothetical protein MTP99_006547 [Tenebrio molitor]|nr:hypothetical protein MTP99_006547 [Tenebrio molitor]
MTQREFTNITLLIIHRGKVQSPSGALVVMSVPPGLRPARCRPPLDSHPSIVASRVSRVPLDRPRCPDFADEPSKTKKHRPG